MTKLIKVDIVSAEASIFSGEAHQVVLSGDLGEFGVMHGHAQLLTSLKPGYVKLHLAEVREEVFYVSGGFAEIQPDIVTILADTAESANNLDEDAVALAQEKARQLLENSQRSNELDYAEILARLAETTAQLNAIRQLKKHY